MRIDLLVVSSVAAFALMVGCGSRASDTDGAGRGSVGKADLVGSCAPSSCDGQAAGGNCFCDDACVDFGDCCEDKAEVCGGVPCETLGGECLSQAGDPGFPALCEQELGRQTLPGECGAVNLACCGGPVEGGDDSGGDDSGGDDSGGDDSGGDDTGGSGDDSGGGACENLGGECLSQPGDPGFPALCEQDLGRESIDAQCPAINEACCGDPIEEPGNPCIAAGGECFSQPGEPGFPALCEQDLGRESIDAQCPAINEACCGDPIEEPGNPCIEAGGECLSQPNDPGFPALCEQDFGRETLDAMCPAFNESCCGVPL